MSTSVRKQNVQVKSKTTRTAARIKDELDEKEQEKKRKVVASKSLGKAATHEVVKATTMTTSKTSSSKNAPVKKLVPTSPANTRVTKTQYYPDKTLYSNALGAAPPKIKQSLVTPTKITAKPVRSKEIISDGSDKRLKADVGKFSTVQKAKSLAEVKKEMREKLKKQTVQSPDASSSSSSKLERPGTATLKEPSIVSTNIAGPNATKVANLIQKEVDSNNSQVKTNLVQVQVNCDDPDDYEDDFESYASDFEEYRSSEASQVSTSEPLDVSTRGEVTSSDADEDVLLPQEESSSPPSPPRQVSSAEEERKLDSGNFDLPTESADAKRVRVLDQIKEHEPVLSSLSDEGFEEQKTSLQFVNFAVAKQQRERQQTASKKNQRGRELMSMIRLDQQNFTLFDLPSQSYDVFMKSFGNRNSAQVASQTGDERIDEELQTDVIAVTNKWTQFPIDRITKSKNLLEFKNDLVGVGGDMLAENFSEESRPFEYNAYNLARFLLAKETLIIDLLRENHYGNTAEFTAGKLPFSQGYLVLNTEDLGPAESIAFSSSIKNPKLITIHKRMELVSKGFVWSLLKPMIPEDNFIAFGEVSDVTFGLGNDKLIFAGFKDGSIAVWDLLEDLSSQHSRPPAFLTDVDMNSTDAIVKIVCFRPVKSKVFQVISLSEMGKVVIWEMIISPTERLGLNRISLSRYKTILLRTQHHLGPSLQCTDFCLNPSDPNHYYISTNHGVILHSLVSGTRTNPKQYNTGSAVKTVNVLESCPHNFRYFLAGCETGEVLLHTKQFEKPLMKISNEVSEASVLGVQWSHHRPGIFYTLDADGYIHIWDLTISDLSPQCSLQLKEKIRIMRATDNYMALVTGDGRIHVHLLNQEHGLQDPDVYTADLRKLNNYIEKL